MALVTPTFPSAPDPDAMFFDRDGVPVAWTRLPSGGSALVEYGPNGVRALPASLMFKPGELACVSREDFERMRAEYNRG